VAARVVVLPAPAAPSMTSSRKLPAIATTTCLCPPSNPSQPKPATAKPPPGWAPGWAPTLWWQEPDGDDETSALPKQPFEQRWHFDVWVAHDEGERRLQAVLDAGGRLVSDRAAPAYWVVEDADGNRSCICTPAGR